MILTKALQDKYVSADPPQIVSRPGGGYYRTTRTKSGQTVTTETAKSVATAYRAGNIISDDIASMPFQQFVKKDGKIERMPTNARTRNTPYLLEISPNNWGWTPFRFKKQSAQWLLYHGNSYIWSPPIRPAQKFILPADATRPVFDNDGNLWYETYFANGKVAYIPAVEVMHTLINPDDTGQIGRGVVTFARETLGRRMAANEQSSELYERGLNAVAYIQMAGMLDGEGREKIRSEYEKTLKGGLAVFDQKVVEFKPITLSMADVQFIEQNEATDRDIANFFGMPLHMLNMGKEAYSSNEQKYMEYLNGTLDSYLVPFEQAARISWLPTNSQDESYFKYNRSSLLRMDAKKRAETNEIKIRSAVMTPNEARGMDEQNGYEGGEKFYMTKNYADVELVNAKEAADANVVRIRSGQLTPNEARAIDNLDPYQPEGDDFYMMKIYAPIDKLKQKDEEPEAEAALAAIEEEAENDKN